ncbi:DNA damage-binding protein 1a [Vitis vinifera]|uniref:DNA damage-binding protein 1a n=1 Tax=Vitis vinifera TaxID=29760 RepID=A0A438DW16_VITVI|nr:DNA damage-binding protein 1a [Vitis vinifera]
MLDVPIYGRIATLELFRPHGEAQDFLFIATERYKFCVLQWDAENSEISIIGVDQMSGVIKEEVFGESRLLRVFMGHILMDGTLTWWLDGHTDVLGRLLLKFFQDFSPFVRLVVENGERIRFWEDHWWGNQSLCSQFVGLYRVISVKNLTVSNVLGNSFPVSWNFNFRHNFTDLEIDLLKSLMSSLSSVLFSPAMADSRKWSLSSSDLFSVKSFFLALSKVSNPILFLPAKFLWSSKAPSKVKALAWLVAHGKVNTNDKLQLRRPYKSLCPNGAFFAKEMENR